MPSISPESGKPGASGATTQKLIPSPRSATASLRMNEPAASPSVRGNERVRNSTFIRSGVRRAVALSREVLYPGAKLVYLGPLRGNHLTKQSGGKEHAADGHARLHEIHQRPEADAADHSPQDGDDPDDHADD